MSEIITINTDAGTEIQKVKVFDLIPETDPILKEVLPEFDFSNPPINPTQLASLLVETCKANNGLGLSANQCGLPYRVFVMGSGDNFVAFFNPKIIAASQEEVLMTEGCLSFPMLALNVKRPAGVVVEYQNHLGETKRENFTGLSGRCFLHELDHMNGVLYTSRAKPLALQQGLKKRKKINGLITKAKKSVEKIGRK